MTAPPVFRSCIVCDLVRPEAAGKLIILGFFGVCPDVQVRVPRLDQPTVLTFLISGDAGAGDFIGDVVVYDEADERAIASTGPMTLTAIPTSTTVLAPALMVVFGHPGRFSVRVMAGDGEHFRAEFQVGRVDVQR